MDMQYSEWHPSEDTDKSGFNIHKILGRDGWSYGTHSHRGFCELVCAVDGEVRNRVNGQELIQKAGDMVLVRECDVHELGGSNFSYVNLMFTTDWLMRLENFVQIPGTAERLLEGDNPPKVSIPDEKRDAWSATLEQLLANRGTVRGRRVFVRFLLSMVVDHLAPVYDMNLPDDMPDWLRATGVSIARRRGQLPSVPELVKQSCRSHEHFTRQFTRYFKVSPARYLANLRVDRAADMLVTTNYKLLDICHAVGFENEGYFYREFKQRKNMTPLAFRRAYGPRSVQR